MSVAQKRVILERAKRNGCQYGPLEEALTLWRPTLVGLWSRIPIIAGIHTLDLFGWHKNPSAFLRLPVSAYPGLSSSILAGVSSLPVRLRSRGKIGHRFAVYHHFETHFLACALSACPSDRPSVDSSSCWQSVSSPCVIEDEPLDR